MNKTELMENYTMEELADMIVVIQNVSEIKKEEIHRMKLQIEKLEEGNGRLRAELDTYNNCLLPRCTKEAKGNAGSDGYCDKEKKTNNFYGLYACSAKDLTKDDVLIFLGILTKELVKNGIDFKFDMKDEMKVYDITVKNNKGMPDILPKESIKAADVLIDTYMSGYEKYVCGFCEPNTGKIISENPCEEVRRQTVSHIRQIAEHLLVYCNANGI